MKLVMEGTAIVLPISMFLFVFTRIASGIDPETISQNDGSQQYDILIDKPNSWIQSHEDLKISVSQACAKTYQPTHIVKRHAKNKPYFIDDASYTLYVIPKRGDSSYNRLRTNQDVIDKAEDKLYQDQLNAEETLYDLKHKENIEALFKSYEPELQMTNIYDNSDVKANMESVFGLSHTELEQKKMSNRLNTADKSFIDDSLMAKIADIFGPPPTKHNLHFKRNIDGNYQGSLQAAIYNSFGPEVRDEGVSTATVDDDDTGDNYGQEDRYQPFDDITKEFGRQHPNSATTQDIKPASTLDSRQISKNKPDSLGSGNAGRAAQPPKKQEAPILLSANDVHDSPSSKTPLLNHGDTFVGDSPPSTTESHNGAPAQQPNLILLQSCLLYCFCLMALFARL